MSSPPPPAKLRPQDLAFLGGPAAFREPLHVGSPNIGKRETLFQHITGALDRRWLTNGGQLTQQFEERIASMLGVKHCVSVCNATVGLEIAAHALGLRGEVIVPAFTFVASAHCLEWLGVTPVFCDVSPETGAIDPAKVEALITPRTTGILAVHVWGRPCDVAALASIAKKHRLSLLFDAAHAFHVSHGGKLVGGFGDAEVFSFHATKFLNCGEGGAITTNDDAVALRLRRMRNFGFVEQDQVETVGTNGKLPELSAALGLTNLDELPSFVAANRRNYHAYREGLRDIPGVRCIEYDAKELNNYQYVVIDIDEGKAGLGRDTLRDVLRAENVLARRYFYPGCHRMEPYRSRPHAALPATEALSERVLQLPNGTAIDIRTVETICQVIRLAVRNSALLRAHASSTVDAAAS